MFLAIFNLLLEFLLIAIILVNHGALQEACNFCEIDLACSYARKTYIDINICLDVSITYCNFPPYFDHKAEHLDSHNL